MCEVTQSVKMSSPFMLVCYTTEESSFHIVVENEIILELPSFKYALIHLMGAYFVFDIAYPKALYSLLLLIQHHIFDLHDSQKSTPSVAEAVSSLKSMDDNVTS